MCLCVCVLCVQEKPVLIFFSASLPFVVEKMCWKRKEQTKKIFAQLRAAPLCSLSLSTSSIPKRSAAQRNVLRNSSDFWAAILSSLWRSLARTAGGRRLPNLWEIYVLVYNYRLRLLNRAQHTHKHKKECFPFSLFAYSLLFAQHRKENRVRVVSRRAMPARPMVTARISATVLALTTARDGGAF